MLRGRVLADAWIQTIGVLVKSNGNYLRIDSSFGYACRQDEGQKEKD